MSGFCALVDLSGAPADRETLLAMASAASRSGTDGRTHRIAGEAGFCHLALHATAESLNERQPLRSPDGSLHLVADVRLDNRGELIDRLTGDGVLDRKDPGDAELILAAWRRWEEDCPVHLLGDFAFVLWDARRKRVFAACDPLGSKPLHWARTGSVLCLASEAQQVLQHPGVSRALDEVAVGDFLACRVPEPPRTFFRDVHRLIPAHRLTVDGIGGRSLRIERFWGVDAGTRTVYARDEDYAAHFLDLFRRAVSDRLRSRSDDVGVLMSGGLDSSSVAATAADCPGNRRLFAASFLFDRLEECDERRFIQATTAGLGLESELIAAERFPVLDDPGTCRPSLEAPFVAWDGCFHEALRRARARGARVLLTGHGGDDLLWGSRLVYADRLRRGDLGAGFEVLRHALANRHAWSWILYNHLVQPLLPKTADRALRRLTGRVADADLPDWIDAGFARRTGLAERARAIPPRRSRDAARQAIHEYFRQTPWDRSSHWYDQHAAAFGIEVRHPFLDRRLIEFLASIPPGQIYKVDLSKRLLRQAMAGLLPEAVRLRRAKTHLNTFHNFSLGGGRRDRIERLLATPLATDLGILDRKHLLAAYKRSQDGGAGEFDLRLWNPIALEVWLREYFHNAASASAVYFPAA
jgi:asparagine synthase (glutamine-hydrolysing)